MVIVICYITAIIHSYFFSDHDQEAFLNSLSTRFCQLHLKKVFSLLTHLFSNLARVLLG